LNEGHADFALARTDFGVAFWIHVSARSRRPKVGGLHGDALRVAVSEPPIDGAANEGCAKARALGVRRSAVALDPASTGRRKRVRIDGDSELLSERLLGLASRARAH